MSHDSFSIVRSSSIFEASTSAHILLVLPSCGNLKDLLKVQYAEQTCKVISTKLVHVAFYMSILSFLNNPEDVLQLIPVLDYMLEFFVDIGLDEVVLFMLGKHRLD